MQANYLSDINDGLRTSTYSIFSNDTIFLEFDSIDECSFTGNSSVTKYPAEIGITLNDYKYSNPDQIQIKGVTTITGDKMTAVEKIRAECNRLVRAMELVNIQTRNSGLRENFTMSNYTIDETPNNFNLLEVDMTFDEVLLFDESGQVTRHVSDTNTQSGGIVQTSSVEVNNDTNSNQSD